MSGVPAGYFVAPDAFNDVWIWRERGDYPVPVVGAHIFRDDPELWDYLVCALPHQVDDVEPLCSCGKAASHVDAREDSQEWACRVPAFDPMTGRMGAR